MFFKTPALDGTLQIYINQELRSPVLDVLMPIVSTHLLFYVLLLPLGMWIWRKYNSRQLLLIPIILLAVGMTDLGTNGIKKATHRVRPYKAVAGTYYVDNGEWQRRPADFVQTKTKGNSYPSAHAANTMCFALLSLLFWPALKKWSLLLPVVVGYSRVYLGKHYPTDVLSGWLFGVVIASTVWLVYKQFTHRNEGKN